MNYNLNMYSKNSMDEQENSRSFIEQARRAQIIEATIDVLAEYGYVNTSFAKIAKHAGISASLISYHFKNKEELTMEVYQAIDSARMANMSAGMTGRNTAAEKLRGLIEIDLTYMGTRPKLFKALVEVLFSIRDAKGFLELVDNTEQPAISMVEETLRLGQKNGEFGEFDAYAMALIVDGARDQFLAQLPMQPQYNLEAFSKTLTALIFSYITKGEK